ncbi:MAG TPA: DUF2292 domain-containing protein [Patescibacteria group bacterium]
MSANLVKENNYSTKRISKVLLGEIITALKRIQGYGSVEIYIQDNQVTQITERNIKKTNSQKGQYVNGQARA